MWTLLVKFSLRNQRETEMKHTTRDTPVDIRGGGEAELNTKNKSLSTQNSEKSLLEIWAEKNSIDEKCVDKNKPENGNVRRPT